MKRSALRLLSLSLLLFAATTADAALVNRNGPLINSVGAGQPAA
jgi:hypothetical protein